MSPHASQDTIAAVATPPGRGGVGVLRVSGPQAAAILRRLVPDWPADHPTHLLRLSSLRDLDGALVDEALAVIMRGPRSYTGEDVVELQCHGGPIILRRLLDAALGAGARMANPGEFTQRAFLHGRLDLTQAEAVADLVQATSERAHKLALEHLRGQLGTLVRQQRELLFEAATLIEAALDFSHEEHVYQIERDEVRQRLTLVQGELEALLATFDQGRRQREGVRVVVTGPTNAGKSTLFNALHGTARAIVTPIAGTTRDFLEEELLLGGATLRLVDTAGLRQTEDHVEALGIERSHEQVRAADVILRVVDASLPLSDAEREQLAADQASDRPVIVVLNKQDLPSGLSPQDHALLASSPRVLSAALGAQPAQGVEALRAQLGQVAQELTLSEGVLISRARHREAVQQAHEAIVRALSALDAQREHELIALDVREALDALGGLVGHVSTDDILHRIFAQFCVGK